jgi:arylsulfatase A-like enzyme/Flp pilus assembly protein TadD
MRGLPFLVVSTLALFLLNAPAALAEAPNIIVITLDTTRADRMGFLGSKRGLTPNLDLIARQGVVFERAYSQAPLTPVSHATIFTGTYPQFHTVTDFAHPLPALLPYVPEILHKSGYRTAAFVGSLIMDPRATFAPGFDRGFDFFDAGYRIKKNRNESRYQTMERRAMEVVGHAVAWIKKNSQGPFFVWVHLYDPHAPYDAPAPYNKYRNAYDGEVAYTDAAVGKLLAYLRSRGLYRGALIAAMSDHGESLGDHGEKMHGIFLYDETIHVPMVFKLPGQVLAGRRVSTRVRLVDFAPTLLQMLSLPLPPTFQGEPLVALMKPAGARGSKPASDLPAYAETDYPHRAFGWSALRSLRSGKYLFVRAPEQELYDMTSDAAAERNLAASSPAVAQTLSYQLDDFRKRTSSAEEGKQEASLSVEQQETLTGLGYIAATPGARSKDPMQGPNPKTKIEFSNVLHEAMIAVEDGRFAEAVPLFRKVLADSPSISIAQMQLGTALAGLRRYQEALAPLRKAVELMPDSAPAHYELALALYETGAWQESAPHFEFVAQKNSKMPDAQYSLASVYARIKRVPEALELLHNVIRLNPQHFRANLLLGRILTLQDQATEAVPYLETAAKVEADSGEAHSFLADAYTRAGRIEEAERERALSRSLQHGISR